MGHETQQISVPTMDSSGARKWLYPDRRQGQHSRRRMLTAIGLMAFYIIAPWLQWNGIPLLRVDVLEKKAFLFGQIFHLNDAGLIAPFLAALALLLFFATSIKGRVWCAYGCPQTVFVEWLIRPIEEFTEGSAHHRRRMDSGPKTPSLMIRKGIKHTLFLFISAIVANTFLSFFFGPERIARWMIQPPSEHPGPFLVMTAIMLVFYTDLAWFREQFCAFVCPYARFQSVMMDQNTPTVTYNVSRGEPRGHFKKKIAESRQHGDCIDCQLCVRVCPTGIDIRNGLQLECIRCARCIDACNMVMTNLGRQENLIQIASQSELSGEKKIPFYRRPKVLSYAAAFAVMVSVGAVRIFGRDSVALNIMRAPGPAYTQMPDGRLGNTFVIRFTNNTAVDVQLDLEVISPRGAQILCAQCQGHVKASDEQRVSAILTFDPRDANQKLLIRNKSTDTTGESLLLGPK